MRLTAIFTKVKERTCQENLVGMIMWYKITQATPPNYHQIKRIWAIKEKNGLRPLTSINLFTLGPHESPSS